MKRTFAISCVVILLLMLLAVPSAQAGRYYRWGGYRPRVVVPNRPYFSYSYGYPYGVRIPAPGYYYGPNGYRSYYRGPYTPYRTFTPYYGYGYRPGIPLYGPGFGIYFRF